MHFPLLKQQVIKSNLAIESPYFKKVYTKLDLQTD
jgi:hypothetical protein